MKRKTKRKVFQMSAESFDSLTVGNIALQTVAQARSCHTVPKRLVSGTVSPPGRPAVAM